MVRIYLDTSAAVKLLVDEPESAALAAALDRLDSEDRLLSGWLLHTELHCALARRVGQLDEASVTAVLDRVTLVDLQRSDLLEAPVLGAGLRSQDAIHLAVAKRAGADSIATYDAEQAAAATVLGLDVLRPS